MIDAPVYVAGHFGLAESNGYVLERLGVVVIMGDLSGEVFPPCGWGGVREAVALGSVLSIEFLLSSLLIKHRTHTNIIMQK